MWWVMKRERNEKEKSRKKDAREMEKERMRKWKLEEREARQMLRKQSK